MDNLERNIDAANNMVVVDEEIETTPAVEEPVASQPIDLYQARQDIQRDYSKKQFPRGSRALVLATVEDVVNGVGTNSLGLAYKRAKDESETLRENGETTRAQLVANQYMLESFLPAVEVVVNMTSPDELLNSKEGLKTLDKYALGAGSMTGYTAAYIREAYANQLGQVSQASDPTVVRAVRRINGLMDSYQMRPAEGLASKIKKQIDEGKHIASSEDYDLIARVAS